MVTVTENLGLPRLRWISGLIETNRNIERTKRSAIALRFCRKKSKA